MDLRIGNGFDVHAFAHDRKLILGGVEVPHDRGLLGHSDADVLTHAIMDALLSAARLGDIGKMFPDTDPKFEGANSIELLRHVTKCINDAGFHIQDIDATLMAERPKLSAHRDDMRHNIAEACSISIEHIGIKATTTEKLGFVGREEGIAASANAILIKE